MSKIYNANLAKMHVSLQPFFTQNILEELIKIEKILDANFTPSIENILKFTQTDLSKIKVIWIGLDPYDEPGIATGRSFEVNNLSSWRSNTHNASLRNILKLLYKSNFQLENAPEIQKIYTEIDKGEFNIKPPDEIFSYWEQQGAIFLNTAFTSRINKSGSEDHLKIWEIFFEKVLRCIIKNNDEIVVFSWGKRVSGKVEKISKDTNTKIYYSFHPRTNGEKPGFKENSYFLNSPCFKDTSHLIQWI